jgi:hypothetical protein
MATANLTIDTSELNEFFEQMKSAGNGDFKKEMMKFLEGLGNEFLSIVEDEIIRKDVTDTRLLLNSFKKSGDGNIWMIEDDGMSLEIGTNVDYASYVNDGHWTNPKGVDTRWVPGKHYWESAIRILDKMIPQLLEVKVQKWIDEYFGRWI